MEKGIAFPVCVSVNEYVCHYSPLHNEDTVIECKCIDSIKIKNRIDSLFVYHIIFKLYIFGFGIHYLSDVDRSDHCLVYSGRGRTAEPL